MTRAPALARARGGTREDVVQANIVEHLRLILISTHVVFAIPNGGLRTKREAARLKWTGTLAGVFDLCILGPGGATWWLETKTATGALNEAQKVFRLHLIAHGIPHAIVRSVADVEAALLLWQIPTKLARAAA